jgi:hypothetical protein
MRESGRSLKVGDSSRTQSRHLESKRVCPSARNPTRRCRYLHAPDTAALRNELGGLNVVLVALRCRRPCHAREVSNLSLRGTKSCGAAAATLNSQLLPDLATERTEVGLLADEEFTEKGLNREWTRMNTNETARDQRTKGPRNKDPPSSAGICRLRSHEREVWSSNSNLKRGVRGEPRRSHCSPSALSAISAFPPD